MRHREDQLQAAIVEFVRTVMAYNPETGEFIRTKPASGGRVGDVCGWVHARGYRYVRACGRVYFAHRLAWLAVHGEWPSGQIDHINGARDDNRIANLRVATGSLNMANRKINVNSSTGLKGVNYKASKKRWVARIQVDGRRREIGQFATAEAAKAAYDAAARDAFGDFARLA